MRLQIAVVVASQPSQNAANEAEAVGAAIAEAGAILVCGGLFGTMEAAAKGAREKGGHTLGILPGNSRRGADSPRNPRSFSTKARTLRFSRGEFPARLWTRRVFAIAFVVKTRDRPAHRVLRAGAARERKNGIARARGRPVGASSRERGQRGPRTRDSHRRRGWTRCSGGTRGLSHLSRTLRDEGVL